MSKQKPKAKLKRYNINNLPERVKASLVVHSDGSTPEKSESNCNNTVEGYKL